jgi:DNA-binding response OmpR family regulator
MGPAPAEPARGVNGARGPNGVHGPNGAHGVRNAPGVPLAVLLAEHEPEVAELARRYLARAGLRVIVAASADDTIAALTRRPAGVAVLDLTMPGLDACHLRRLLAEPHARAVPAAEPPTPAVYLLGASMRPRDLRLSADQCLRRPFSPRMLVSRVVSAAVPAPGITPAITRTPGSPAAPPGRPADLLTYRPAEQPADRPTYRPEERPADRPIVRNLTLDPATRRARTAHREISLTPAEFALLSALAEHAGRVLTRDRLQAAMGPAYRPGSGRVVDVHIAQLRAKLATSAVAAAIRTVRGVGYILDDPTDSAHTASNRGVPATPLTAPR